jgi:carbonic anhydrase
MTTAKDETGLDLDIKDAIEGYERFRLEFERDRSFFRSLATKKQKPRLLWIGCCAAASFRPRYVGGSRGLAVGNIASAFACGAERAQSARQSVCAQPSHRRHHGCGHTVPGIQALAEPMPASGSSSRALGQSRACARSRHAARVPDEKNLIRSGSYSVSARQPHDYEIVAKSVAEGSQYPQLALRHGAGEIKALP